MNRGKFVVASLAARTLSVLRSTDEPRQGTRVMMYHDINESGVIDDIYSIPVKAFSRGVAGLAEWAGIERSFLLLLARRLESQSHSTTATDQRCFSPHQCLKILRSLFMSSSQSHSSSKAIPVICRKAM